MTVIERHERQHGHAIDEQLLAQRFAFHDEIVVIVVAGVPRVPAPLQAPVVDRQAPCHNTSVRFQLDDLVIDSERFTVERSGTAVRVEPQVFDVLCYLAENRDRVVPKEELLDEIWGDRFVSESALSSRIKSVRKLMGDDGARQEVIKTAHGRGFRWVADIDVLEASTPVRSSPTEARPPAQIRPTPPPGLHTDTLGRDHTVREVAEALANRRLVTLIGPPGIGKTRTALEVLRRRDAGASDVAFVELHTATTRSDIIRLVLQAVGLDLEASSLIEPTNEGLERWLIEHLTCSEILLVLDNCEHVARHVAGFASALLASAPTVTILATSRRTLWVDGEQLIGVRPLGQPDDETWADLESSPAGRLFLNRSTAAGATWSHTADEADIIHEVCRRLDGVPLAIELAAARTRWMPLERLLSDLTDPSSNRPRRHDPLAISLAASRALLDEAARTAFDAISVFAGSFRLDAALHIIAAVRPTDDPLDVFQQLVDHSLVDVVDAGRYRLLVPVREFAASGVPRTEIAGPALLAYYAEIVERTWPAGSTVPPVAWNALDADIGDILNLVERANDIDPAGGRRLVGSLGLYWWVGQAVQQCVTVCDELGEPNGDEPAVAARYLLTWSMCSSILWQPMPDRAEQAHQLAIETGQWSVAASALSLVVASDQTWADLDAVESVWEEVESLYRRADDVAGEAWALVRVLGLAQSSAGRSAEAALSFRAAIDLFERVGDDIGVATAALRLAREAVWIGNDADLGEEALSLLPGQLGSSELAESLPYDLLAEAWLSSGRAAEARGDVDEAIERHRRSLLTSEAHVPGSIVTNSLRVQLAGVLRRSGRFAEAVTYLRQAATTALRSGAGGRSGHMVWVVENVAGLLAELGRYEDAATLFGAAEAGRDSLEDSTMRIWDRDGFERDVASIPPSAETSRAREDGRHLDFDAAGRLALAACDGLRFEGSTDTLQR